MFYLRIIVCLFADSLQVIPKTSEEILPPLIQDLRCKRIRLVSRHNPQVAEANPIVSWQSVLMIDR